MLIDHMKQQFTIDLCWKTERWIHPSINL